MNDPTTQPPNDAGRVRFQHRCVTLFFLFWAYFSVNLVFRWLRWCLLFGQAKEGWSEPTLGTTLYQVFMACLPAAFWLWLVYALTLRFPRLLNRVVVTVTMLAVVLVTELDMSWFLMSRAHITRADTMAFLTGSTDDFGMEPAEVLRFLKRLGQHVLCIGLLALVALPLGSFLGKHNVLARMRLGWKPLGLVLGLLVVADGAWVGYCARHDTGQYSPSSWGFLAYANPARIAPVDAFWKKVFHRQPDLDEANKGLVQAQPAAGEPRTHSSERGVAGTSVPSSRPYNVVVIAVESLNARVLARTAMPFWKELAGRSFQLERHYTTGNCTHYGVLGLLYGAPPYFYDGALGQAESPFLSLLARQGYRSRRISWPLAGFRNLGNYLGGFTEPVFEDRDEWRLIPEVRATLSRPGPHFLFLFYNKTHYSYRHKPSYNRYQPEVPEDFHFQRWDASRHAPDIVHRYQNCLLEFDDWLRTLVREIDLDRTILVVTGDHGEEFFETGKFGHCSSLDEAQTHVPCLISLPGKRGGKVSRVTSHADVMPTVVETLGWQAPVPCYGQSIFQGQAPRSAVVAQSNQHHRPTVWAVVSADRKAILEGRNRLRIIALFDRDDHKLEYRAHPSGWSATFAAAQRFQKALLEFTLPGEADPEPLVSQRK